MSKTVIRGGFGRSYDIGRLRIAVRSQRDPEPARPERAGTEWRPARLRCGVQPRSGVHRRPIFQIQTAARFHCPNGVFARALPTQQRPPTVDAFNVIVQRQLSDTMSVEAGYVGNRGRDVFAGDGPDVNINQATLNGYLQGVPQNNRRPFFNKFGWTQDIAYFCNCATNAYDSLQAKFNKRFSGGYSVKANYTLQRAVMNDAQYFETDLPEHQGLFDSDLNRGPAGWDRTHNAVLSLVAELPIGRNRRYLADVSPTVDAIIGGWQFNANHIMQSGLPFDVIVPRRGCGS